MTTQLRGFARVALITLVVAAVGLAMTGPLASSATSGADQGMPSPMTVIESESLAIPTAQDENPVEVGLRFTPKLPGAVAALRFHKGSEQAGEDQTGRLWTEEGDLLAEVDFADQTASGWQVARLSAPVTLVPGTMYVVSYFAPIGNYSYSHGQHSSATDGTWYTLPKDAGVYRYGAGGGFPTDSYESSSYFVDVIFQPSVTVFGDERPNFFESSDDNAVELGLEFTPTMSGYATGARFYKAGSSLGDSQRVRLWAGDEVLAEVTISTDAEPGWQVAHFDAPVALDAGSRYVVSYFAPLGRYVVEQDSLTSQQSGTWYELSPGAGVFRYGSSGGMPIATYKGSNYFVDAVFIPQLDLTSITHPESTTVTPTAGVKAQPMKVISRGVPAFSSSGSAGSANDDDYDSAWAPESPGWLAYDLSAVPEAERRTVILAWYTRTDDGYSTLGDVGVCPAWSGNPFLSDYSVELNSAPGGGASAPEAGWTTVAEVSGNGHLAGQHVIESEGFNWVRIVGSGPNGVDINVDVVDAGAGVSDGWLFMGDSITSPWAGHGSRIDEGGGTVPSFSGLVSAGTQGRFHPIAQNGGRDCSTADAALTWIGAMLDGAPGKYVALSFGTNDGWAGSGDAEGFAANMEALADKVLEAGKVPFIPTIPWPNNGGSWDSQVQNMNNLIRDLHQRRPDIMPGPDLYELLRDRPELYRGEGDVHPNGEGSALIRKAWAQAALDSVYQADSEAAPSPPAEPSGAAGLRVEGSRFVDSEGGPVVLRGVNRAGSEYACIDGWGVFDGPADQASIDAMKTWNINAVRVPLNSACWLDIKHQFANYNASFAGSAYQSAIEDYVRLLADSGIYAILDLHWSGCGENGCLANWLKPMPDQPYAEQFWSSVADRFKDQHTVIFDLFNEPTVGDWSCWAEGGCRAFEGDPSNEFTMAGMATMVAAVRAAGATEQPIMIGGLQYANDMRGWLEHLPDDPSESLVASIHLYDFNYPCPTMVGGSQTAQAAIECLSDDALNGILPIAEQHPVVFGELGQSGCSTDFVEPMLSWITSQDFSVVGWAWNTFDCSDFPAMISSYDGTPTPFGEAFRNSFTSALS